MLLHHNSDQYGLVINILFAVHCVKEVIYIFVRNTMYISSEP